MQQWTGLLGTIGAVRTFDYDYMREQRRRPDPLPQLIAAHRAALAAARQSHDGPIILAGKSMGGRIGCHVSLGTDVAGLICFGYPLCGGGDPAKLRDKILRKISASILFLQGTRDPLCPLDLLEEVRAEMKAPNELYTVTGGNHSLGITRTQLKAAGETREEVDARILHAIAEWLVRAV